MPPSPYEISKAKREEATKRRQESQQEEPDRQHQPTLPRSEPSVTTQIGQRPSQPSLAPEISAKDSSSEHASIDESYTEEVVTPAPQPMPAELSDFDVLSFSEISSNEEEDDFHRSQMSQLSEQRSNGKQYRASTPPLLLAKVEATQKKHINSIPDDWPQSPTPQSWRNSPQAHLTLPDSLSPPLPVPPITSDIELTDDDDIAIEQTILEKEHMSSPGEAATPEDQAILEKEHTSSPGRADTPDEFRILDREQSSSPGRATTHDEPTIFDTEQPPSSGRAITPDEPTVVDTEQPPSPGRAVTPNRQTILTTEQPPSLEENVTPGGTTVFEREASSGRAVTPEEQPVLENEQRSASERFTTPDEQRLQTRRSSSSTEPVQQQTTSPQQDSFVDFKLPAKLLTARPSKPRSRGVLGKVKSERISKGMVFFR